MPLSFELNGTPKTLENVPEGSSLLNVLREDLGEDRVTSVKDGCSPQGQCGACLVLINGKPQVSCAMPATKAEGKTIETLEGVSAEERALFAEAFARVGGLQCGFCIPGFVMRAKSLLDANDSPSDEEIRKKLDVHLCRCTGYQSIVQAIQTVAEVRRGGTMPAQDNTGLVGTSLDRYQAQALTLGDRDYVDDMYPQGLLHGAVRLSDHARARILKIDSTKAEAMPGVKKVVTFKDVPGERYYGLIVKDWPGFIAVGEVTHCAGSVIAAVAADDVRVAHAAAAAIEIEYEVLPAIVDPAKAILPDSPRVHADRPNELSRSQIDRGDAEAALKGAAHVVEHTFETQRIEHAFLEPESALAVPEDDGVIHLYTQGQGIFDDQRQCAAFLAVPEEKLQVTLVPNGGAFGGKEDMSVQAHACLLAQVTGQPVKVKLTRVQSIRMHPKRHPITMHYTVGCDDKGALVAVKARMIGDTGAYASVGAKVLERAGGHACGPYRVDNVNLEAVASYTNNPPCGAMRGFGANQAHFAMESCMDMLAAKVGMDRWDFRYLNAVEVGDIFSTGQVLDKAVGIKKTLDAIKPAYDEAVKAGKSVGIACGLKNTGIGNGASEWGKCRFVVEAPDRVVIYNGYTEMGQGLLTILIQCAVQESGLSPDVFEAKVDTTFKLQCGQTTGSRATLFAGNAAILAGKKLKEALDASQDGLTSLVGQVFEGDFLIDDTVPLGAPVDKPKTHTSFGYATQLVILDGEGHLEKVVAAHDVGKALNPTLCRGQIEGAIHMGLGYALTEDLICDENGIVQNDTMRGLGILRARHTPPIEVILVEEHEPEGPYGAKGVGEIGLVPTAGAVAGALFDFDGKRRFKLPMIDSPTGLKVVGKKRK